MAKTKKELLKEAQAGGIVPEAATEDDYTAEDLEYLLNPEKPAWQGSLSTSVPVVAPDGHVSLSKEDIRARNG